MTCMPTTKPNNPNPQLTRLLKAVAVMLENGRAEEVDDEIAYIFEPNDVNEVRMLTEEILQETYDNLDAVVISPSEDDEEDDDDEYPDEDEDEAEDDPDSIPY